MKSNRTELSKDQIETMKRITEVSMEFISTTAGTNTTSGGANNNADGAGNGENDDATNANNNQLGEFSHSTRINNKRKPGIFGNMTFLLAVADVALASVCTW